MKIEMRADLRGWFRERLSEALERRGLPATEITRLYLVELLSRFATQPPTESLGRPLALQLADATEASGAERIRRLRGLGDVALYLSGFFSDHIERRGVSLSYFVSMGESAYSSAGSLAAYSPAEAVRSPVYVELAETFEELVLTFDDLRETTTLRTPQDIVKLYDRWRRTRSPQIAERLREEGVLPSAVPPSRLLH